MNYQAFKELVSEYLDEIPERFMDGLQAVHVFEQAKGNASTGPMLYRLGEYLDPGPDETFRPGVHLGRHVALYYGSFVAIAQHNPGFDWEIQAWEVLTHELQHHLESRAGERTLIEWDKTELQRMRREHLERLKIFRRSA